MVVTSILVSTLGACQNVIKSKDMSGEGGQESQVAASASASDSDQKPLIPEVPCINSNMLWRFAKTGTIECQHGATIDFVDKATNQPLMGALYKIAIDVYISIPLKDFFKKMLEQSKVVTLNTQTAFVKVQLADDQSNQKPINAVIKVKPTIQYTFSGVCSVRLEDLKFQIEEIKAPDFGPIVDRIPGIVNGMVAIHKQAAIKAIQGKIDALAQSKFCWYYRYIYESETLKSVPDQPKEPLFVEPTPQEKSEAQQIVAGTLKKPEAENSEIDTYNAKKWDEFSSKWDCKWFGGC